MIRQQETALVPSARDAAVQYRVKQWRVAQESELPDLERSLSLLFVVR